MMLGCQACLSCCGVIVGKRGKSVGVWWRTGEGDAVAVQSNRQRWELDSCTDPKPRCMSVRCCLVSGSGGSVVFVDHTAEYAVASDQAVNW
jgi:hypothetical protein